MKFSTCQINCGQPLPNDIKRVGRHNEVFASRKTIKASIIIMDHEQKRTTQLMQLQILLGVKPKHESSEIGAILLQLPLAVHLHKRKKLHACGADHMMRRKRQLSITMPYKLPCANTTIAKTSKNHTQHPCTQTSNEINLFKKNEKNHKPNLDCRNLVPCRNECE